MNGAFQSQVAMLQVLLKTRLLRAVMLKAIKMLGEHFFKPSKLCKSFYINDLQQLVRGTPLKPRLCKKGDEENETERRL